MKTTANNSIRTGILALVLVIFVPAALSAQQIIRFKSGYEYRVVIVEKTADSLRYQLVSDPSKTLTAPLDQIETIKADPATILSTQPVPGGPGYTHDYQVHDKAYWEKRAKKYTGFTIAGGVLFAVGGGLTAYNIAYRNEHIDDVGDFQQKWGLSFIGVASLVTGSIFLISGAVNLGVANRELKKYKVEVEANPGISGVTVRLKF